MKWNQPDDEGLGIHVPGSFVENAYLKGVHKRQHKEPFEPLHVGHTATSNQQEPQSGGVPELLWAERAIGNS